MNAAIASRSFHKRVEWAVRVVAVLAMLATAASTALASGLPAATNSEQARVRTYAVSDCQASLVQAALDRRGVNPPLAGWALLSSDAGYYDLWHPAGWSVSSGVQGSLLLTPAGQYEGSHFSIQVMDTPNVMTVDDLTWRIRWFDILLQALPNAQVEWQARWRSGNVTGFDARYTYQDGDSTVWRRVRLLYVGIHQYWLAAEARSAADFDNLEPMFLAMMVTFRPQEQVDEVGVDTCTF